MTYRIIRTINLSREDIVSLIEEKYVVQIENYTLSAKGFKGGLK